MKKVIILIIVSILFSCNGNKKQSQLDTAINNSAKATVVLNCPELGGQLPKIATFDKNPVEIFKTFGKNTEKLPVDSIAQIWDNVFKSKNAGDIKNMFPEGTLFIGDSGKYWIATKSVIKNNSLFIWSQEINFVNGSTVSITWSCDNKIKL
jgi:hypothetical protein